MYRRALGRVFYLGVVLLSKEIEAVQDSPENGFGRKRAERTARIERARKEDRDKFNEQLARGRVPRGETATAKFVGKYGEYGQMLLARAAL